MANEYASSDELKATLELAGETFADPDIALALTAASRAIDNCTRRRFYPDADANQIRYYSPRSASLLAIDDLIEVTEIATGQGDNAFATVWAENTDYVLSPLNAAADGRPYQSIRATSSKAFPCALRSVRVTGKFGWTTAPDEIKQATVILASKLMRRAREAPFGIAMFGADGEAARIARTDPDVGMLIGPFIRQLVR